MRSIQWRITIPVVLLIAGSLSVLGFYSANLVQDTQMDNLRTQLTAEAKLTAEAVLPGFIDTQEKALLDELAKRLGAQIQARVTIIARDGTVLGDSLEDPATMDNHANRPEVTGALTSGIGQSTRYSTTLSQQVMYVAAPVSSRGEIVGIARVALPLAIAEALRDRAVTAIIWTLSIIMVSAIMLVVLITRRSTQPVRQITRAARRIASGELDQRIQVSTKDEVGQLARTFNEMSLSLRKMMANVSEERTRLATVLGNMADGVIMTDSKGAVTLANKAAEGFFGFEAEKATGHTLIEAVRDYEVDELVKSCLRTGQEQTAQLESGTTQRFLRAIAVPVGTERTGGVLIIFQDLTEVKNLQTTRREFIGNVSHEFKTPLTTIKAIVETLQDIEDPKVARDFLEKINSEVDRMTQMVKELSELSRIETGKAQLRLEPADINLLIEEVARRFDAFATRQQVALDIETASGLPKIHIDKERIQHVIANLVHNAIKFTPAGGNVEISTRPKGNSVIVSVSDNGTGIAREDLPHIFERFFKVDRARSSEGTGLGLAVARHIVQAHGGSIWVESEEGQGSTFSFSLPV